MVKPLGTYAGLKLDEASQMKVARFITMNNIFNGLSASDLHSTVIYSTVHCPDLQDQEVDISAKVAGIKLIESDGKICLTLELDSPEQVALHKSLRKKHGANHGFPDYITHITLSYDMGPFEPPDVKGLGPLKFDRLVVNDLNPDWTA